MTIRNKRIFKHYHQLDSMDCGAACLRMIASYYGKEYPSSVLREYTYVVKDGVSLLGITEAAKKVGFKSSSSLLSVSDLQKALLPAILYWNNNHFVVLKTIKKRKRRSTYQIADPAHGIITLSEDRFLKSWLDTDSKGIALFLAPDDDFYTKSPPPNTGISFKYLVRYLRPFRKQLLYMISMLLLGSGITLVLPFLTQILIDRGVTQGNINIITTVLLAQLCLFIGSLIIEIIRNWLVLSVGTKLSITIISDFLKKVLQLPLKFFDTKLTGDFNQRIQDNQRIEEFLTSQSITTLFSFISFSVFFIVLLYYDIAILAVFLILTALSIIWSVFWLRRRKIFDYHRFQQKSESQQSVYEIINGISDMKLNQMEDYKVDIWKEIQIKLFNTNKRIIKIDQLQLSGFEFLNQVKNILVTFMAAIYVVNGKMTLGELLSVSYIIGQLNSPIDQLIDFFRSSQDAKLSLERLNEVQNQLPEERKDQVSLPGSLDPIAIELKDVCFQYEGPRSPFVLNNISIKIPRGKITAIVGESGSGKTTLMKLLLKFYTPTSGTIKFDGLDLDKLSAKDLRRNCGAVMQDGYIFSDSIERNIASGNSAIMEDRLLRSAYISCIDSFVEQMPLRYKTKIGSAGNNLSVGQKQRVLIARAVYKNPEYIFLDEATNSLDANNEKNIIHRLNGFFQGKTVLIIAHRLSTVKSADQIIVMNRGKIVEIGNHLELVQLKGRYFQLVKNQLELGT